MVMVNKYELIDDVIVKVNELTDARGVDKCVHIIESIQNLNTLKGLLRDEDKTHEAAIKELTSKLDSKTTDEEADSIEDDHVD